MLSLDGRASRTLKSLETAIEQAQESISKVNYDDQPLSTSQLKDFKAEATQRMAVLNSAAKKAKETLTRVGKSNNKDSFQIQMDKLQGLAALASAGSKLLAQVIAPTLDADAYISAHEEVASNGGKLGPLYWLKLVVANGQKELLYGKYSGFCEAFVLSKDQHDKPINKLETLMGKDEAAKRCAVEVENRMLASLRAIPASELALLGAGKTAADLGSEAPRLNESLDFAAAMLEACYEHSEEFMAAELKESVRTVQCFLGQDHVGALLEQVSALSSNRLVAMPALQRFFLQHDTGKSLFATAQLRVEHCDKEKEFQDKLDLLEKAVKHLAAWQKQSLPEAESGVAAVHKRIEPAVEALEVVKQTSFFAEMKKKKQEHASNRLLPDLGRLEEQLGLRSSEMVWLICKENMENHLNYFSNALEKECMVDLGHGASGLINLDEILLSFKATAFVSLKVWDKLPSAAAAVKQYKEASELAANVAQYVFQKHAAFSQMPSGGKAVEPETLHKWKVSGFTLVQPYVPEEVAKGFETMFVAVVEAELATVFSKGLDSVAPIVSKCVKGLLGAGLSRQIREETMQRIPASHRLKDLVDLFLQIAELPGLSTDPQVMCQLSHALLAFWLKLQPLLEQVQNKSAPADLLAELGQVGFSEPQTLAWLTSSVAQLGSNLSKACKAELEETWTAAAELEKCCAKLPDPASNEDLYRGEGVKLTKTMADLVAQIGKTEKNRMKMVEAVKKLSQIQLPGTMGENGFNALFQEYNGGEAGYTSKVLSAAASGSVHVAMVAGLCLLRNAALGASNDEGKMIRKQLHSVAEALKQKVEALKLADSADQALVTKAEKVLKEAASQEKVGAADAKSQAAGKDLAPQKNKDGKEKAHKEEKEEKMKKEKKDKDKEHKKEKKEKKEKKKEKEASADEAPEPAPKKRRTNEEAASQEVATKGKGRGRGRGKR